MPSNKHQFRLTALRQSIRALVPLSPSSDLVVTTKPPNVLGYSGQSTENDSIPVLLFIRARTHQPNGAFKMTGSQRDASSNASVPVVRRRLRRFGL